MICFSDVVIESLLNQTFYGGLRPIPTSSRRTGDLKEFTRFFKVTICDLKKAVSLRRLDFVRFVRFVCFFPSSAMKTVSQLHPPPLIPDLKEAQQAKKAARLFASRVGIKEDKCFRFFPSDSTQPVEVPESAFKLFLEILNQMAQGNAVTLVPTHHELTTQEAANLLRVSRPYFVKLLEDGAIKFHRVGSRRRVRFTDLMAYMEKMKGQSATALEELAAQAQEIGLGY
jgi:excisionase family DNA binding protein